MKRLLIGIKDYLSDWKNWVLHGLVGVILLIFVLFAPLNVYVRLAILGCVIAFNVFRMKYLDSSSQKG
ncbi:MAG: hypothetical protein ACXVHS_08030 [Methanobacterium sp.]